MSTIAAGTTSGTALVTSGDTTGQLVLQTNGTTTAVTIGTNQVVSLAQPLPVASGGTGSTTGVNLASSVTGTLPVANGGTGASSLTANNVLLGNGTSAVQVVAPGTNGNVLTSNGTTWTSATPSTGAMVLLQTVTASNSSTVALETGIGSSYDTYLVTFSDVTPVTDSVALFVQLMFSGTYQTSTRCTGYYSASDSGSIYNLNEGQCNITRYSLADYTVTGKNASGEVFFNRTTNSKYQSVRFRTSAWSPNGYGTNVTADSSGSGMWLYTTAVQGIRFFMGSGNIFGGVFRLYGIKNS